MATPKASFCIRSISLPSTSHPLNASVDDHLQRLRASQETPSSSSSSICKNLINIKDLYEQMNVLIHLPHNQQLLSHELVRDEIEQVLDGSLALLDVSSLALDAISLMKEALLHLRSTIRRGGDSEGIHAYLMSRKKICKMVLKCLVNVKQLGEKKHENETMVVNLLKEVQVNSLSGLRGVLCFVIGKKRAMTLTSKWSLVLKLVKSKSLSCEEESEVDEIDCVIKSLCKKQLGSHEAKFVILKKLEALEMIISELEDGLECVSRCLVKTRVSLLNVLSH